MPAERILPSDSILEKWIAEGLSHSQICDRVEEQSGRRPSRSAVSVALSRAGLTNRIRYDNWLPWKHISIEHNHANDAQKLRMGARLMYDVGVNGSSETDTATFTNWCRRLRDAEAVVYYNEELPEGFGWTKARAIDTGLVRYPRGVRAPDVEAFVNALLDGASLKAARRAARAALSVPV